jgi:hypothetical protein
MAWNNKYGMRMQSESKRPRIKLSVGASVLAKLELEFLVQGEREVIFASSQMLCTLFGNLKCATLYLLVQLYSINLFKLSTFLEYSW